MIISRTPLRVSFVGGGTDLPSFCNKERGSVVSVAIKKYVYIVLHPSFDKKNLISYSKIEKTDFADEIQNPLIREALKLTGIPKGIEMHSIAEVPSGTGLGSSSTYAVGLLNALYAFMGKHASARKLADEACKIEIDILKDPIGRQDQYAAAYGGLNKIDFMKDEVRIKPIICKKDTKKQLEKNLLLFRLNGQRHASSVLNEQNHNVNSNDDLFNNCKMMRDLADEMEKSLYENNLNSFGKLLHENWLLKKQLASNISNPQIDSYYDKALKSGAIGGKVLGAGGTGFLLVYAEEDKHDDVRKALSELEENNLEFDTEGSKIIYVND